MTSEQAVHIYSGKLYEWQKASAKVLAKFKNDLIYTILAPRQIGKTHFVEMYTLSRCINSRNQRVVIVNPTFSNSKRTYNDFMKWLRQMPPEIVTSANASDLQIKFSNNSTIQLKSIEQGNGLRGDHCNTLIIDEAAFIPTTEAMSLLFPYVNATHGSILLISTPTFKDEYNLFFKFWQLAHTTEKANIQYADWSKYDTSAVLTPEKKELLKQTMPYNIFCNEILGEFLTEKTDLWDIAPILKNGTLPTAKMFGGLDWGSSGTDNTVLSVFNENRQMYRLLRLDHDTPPTEQIKIILATVKELKLNTVVYESNSIGFPLADFLKTEAARQHIQCRFVAFNTSNESKRNIVEQMQILIQNQQISLLDDMQLKLQFTHFEMKSTPSGKITYGNSSDTIHDDIVIATALALTADSRGSYAIK